MENATEETSELHSLLALATTEQQERLPIALARNRPATSIEHQYLMIVVLQLIDTGNLTPRQIEQVWEELDGWCGSLRLSLGPKTVSSFYVDLASREGLKRRPSGALEGSVLFVDTQPLHAVMMQHEITLEQFLVGERPRHEQAMQFGRLFRCVFHGSLP